MGTTTVADALFTKVQQRVLAVLFGNPGRSYYLNEVVARAGIGTGAVQRELARLEDAGLVTAERVGRQKHFQANPASPVFEELRGLIRKTTGLADVLREALAPIAAKIRCAFVFGSVAGGTETSASDVDVMVISDTLSYADVFASVSDAEQRIGRKINPTIYSRDELEKRLRGSSAFVTRVFAKPKVWLIGAESDLPAR